jgi:siroheme synthase
MKHYLGICLILLTGAAIVLFGVHSCSQTVDHTIDHVREAFSQVLNIQPQVTVNQRVILTQTAPIAELAVVTKEELVASGSAYR